MAGEAAACHQGAVRQGLFKGELQTKVFCSSGANGDK